MLQLFREIYHSAHHCKLVVTTIHQCIWEVCVALHMYIWLSLMRMHIQRMNTLVSKDTYLCDSPHKRTQSHAFLRKQSNKRARHTHIHTKQFGFNLNSKTTKIKNRVNELHTSSQRIEIVLRPEWRYLGEWRTITRVLFFLLN